MRSLREWWAGRNSARFYRCRSRKCGYVWARRGKIWEGPYVPYEPGDQQLIMFTFGDYYPGFAKECTAKEVQDGWSDCWPLQEIKRDETPKT